MGIEPLNFGQPELNCFVICRFKLRQPRSNGYSSFWFLAGTYPGPSNLVLTSFIGGSKASLEFFEHLLDRIAPTGILEVPTTNRLLDLSSELVYSLNL